MTAFKKIFFSFLIFFLFLNTNSYAEIINKIEVQGNERISNETIVIFGDIVIGKNYKESDINLLIKKLYETTYFSQININLKDNTLLIEVKENPIVNLIVFDGEKAKKFKDKITELLTIREKSSFVSTNIKGDVNKIKSYYKMLGYYFVKIEVDVVDLEKNRVNIIYSIDKGEKAKIAKIYFLGDKVIRDKRLRDVITSQENAFWKVISRNVYLSEERIELDKRLLKNYYINKGYYEVNLTSTNVEYSEGEGFVLTFSIDAGKRYKFKKIFADVAPALDKTAFASLEQMFTTLVGKYYSRTKINAVLEEIDQLSEQKELQFINHSISETLEEDAIVVKINIYEGEKFIIEKVNIAGNTVTNDSVIRSELKVDEGDPYSALLVKKSINKIKGRGIFGKVDYKVVEGSSRDLKILEIDVEEKSTGEIMAGAGIGTEGTSFQFSIRENNWLGRGLGLQTSFNVSKEKISGNFALKNPNYNYTGNALNTSLNVSSTDRTTSTGYKSEKTGFKIGTGFEQWEDVYFTPSLSIAHESIDAEATASTAIKKMDGTYLNSDFSYALIWDKRNHTFEPTEGYRTQFNQKIPLIQDSSSLMNGLDVSVYKEYSEDIIGSFKLYSRTIHGIDDDVRLTDRLFMPALTLRGFERGKVGPKDGADWVGGNYIGAVSLEAQLPNLLPEAYKTDFSAFFDTANIWGVDYSSAVDDSSKIRASIGLSANIFTTVGPMSFTIAQALSQTSTDETQLMNFRLGTSF